MPSQPDGAADPARASQAARASGCLACGGAGCGLCRGRGGGPGALAASPRAARGDAGAEERAAPSGGGPAVPPTEADSLLPLLDDPGAGASLDPFAAAGLKMPAHLATRGRRWLSLVLVIVSSSLASGPMSSWPTLEPLLIAEGVWEGPGQEARLEQVFSLAICIAMAAGTVSGALFDVFGPRALMVVGAVGVVVCQVVMAVAVQYQRMNDLLWVFYPATTFFGWTNLTGVYAWLWLLPGDESLVSAMIGSIQIFSDSLVMVAVWLNSSFGATLPFFFLLVAAMALLSGVVALAMVPSLEEHKSYAAAAGGEATEAKGSLPGGHAAEPEPPPGAASSEGGACRQLRDNLRDTGAVFCLVHPGACSLSLGFFTCAYMWTVLPTLDMYRWYSTMFGEDSVTSLVSIWGATYGCVGAVSLMLLGGCVDRAGFVPTLAWLNVPFLMNTVLLCIADFQAQVWAQVFLAVLTNAHWAVLLPRFCIHYVPPQLFGTYNGLVMTFLGMGQLVLAPLGEAASGAVQERWEGLGLPRLGEAGPYRVAFCLWFMATEVFCALFLLSLLRRPLPPAESTTLAEVRRALAARRGATAAAKAAAVADA